MALIGMTICHNVLFAYRNCVQQSTGESLFFLLYGRDPRLPTDKALSLPEGVEIDLENYRSDLVRCMSEAWGLAQESVRKAQKSQKKFHDRHAKDPHFKIGDRVFIFMPAEKSGQAYEFAEPFRCPYRVEKFTRLVLTLE